jgi:hypothetical protein
VAFGALLFQAGSSGRGVHSTLGIIRPLSGPSWPGGAAKWLFLDQLGHRRNALRGLQPRMGRHAEAISAKAPCPIPRGTIWLVLDIAQQGNCLTRAIRSAAPFFHRERTKWDAVAERAARFIARFRQDSSCEDT